MDYHYFHISFVWKNTFKTTVLDPIFDLADEWIRYGGYNWIIYTREDQLIWTKRLWAVLGADDQLMILELTKPPLASGMMPQWVWDWMNKSRPAGFVIPPPPPILGLR
jgi:hypothetical protein